MRLQERSQMGKAELSCVTQEEFGGDYSRWSEFKDFSFGGSVEALESPALVNLYIEGKLFTQKTHKTAIYRPVDYTGGT